MLGRGGVAGALPLLVTVAAVSVALFVGVGYWAGFLSVGREQARERLEVSSVAVVEVDGERYLRVLVKNIGLGEVRLEHATLNGAVASYFVQKYGILVESRGLVMPAGFQVELYIPFRAVRGYSVEIGLHTALGGSFTKAFPLS